MIKTAIRGKKIRVGDVPALILFSGSTWSIYLSSTLPGHVPGVVRVVPSWSLLKPPRLSTHSTNLGAKAPFRRVLPLLLSSALIRSTIADSVVFVNDADGPFHFQ